MASNYSQMSISRLSTALFLAGCTAIIGGAQLDQVLPAGRAFQVASIKRNLSESSRRTVIDGPQPGGGWTLINGTIFMLIAFAYAPGQTELLGFPSWVVSERYDIIAKSDGAATVAETRTMVRALLTERFGFRMHIETRRQRIYALEFAREDRSLGPGFRKIDVDCALIFTQTISGTLDVADVENASNGAPRCRIQTTITATPNGRVTTLKSGGAPLAQLLAAIGAAVGRPVVNKTGLDGSMNTRWNFRPQCLLRAMLAAHRRSLPRSASSSR